MFPDLRKCICDMGVKIVNWGWAGLGCRLLVDVLQVMKLAVQAQQHVPVFARFLISI